MTLLDNYVDSHRSDRFNKSATLDIEARLIQYLSGESYFKLQNANSGLQHHNYYQRSLYSGLFREIWEKLRKEDLVKHSIEEIENSDLFKYSPYKALSSDQRESITQILQSLVAPTGFPIFVSGGAGTGKTILATYLMKALASELPDEDEVKDFSEQSLAEYQMLRCLKDSNPSPRIGLVVPMASLRKTLQNVFREISGLKPSMVIGPSDVLKRNYDIVLVDEAHRLMRRKNITAYQPFDQNNRALGLGNEGTQLDWILRRTGQQVFFYDSEQSVKPSDIPRERFTEVIAGRPMIQLKSQMRVKAGEGYIDFVNDLLEVREVRSFQGSSDYELVFFDSLDELYERLKMREKKFQLCRLVAGYAWKWVSKNDPSLFDIEIDGLQLKWNQEHIGWINSETAAKEVGCIHTVQGYDLNYVGVIFGPEVIFNKDSGTIEVLRHRYEDRNGKAGVENDQDLKRYVLNIYKTLMCRGIHGTFVYACDPALNDYLRRSFESVGVECVGAVGSEGAEPFKVLDQEELSTSRCAIPKLNIQAAAGGFSPEQWIDDCEWVELADEIQVGPDHFIAQVCGESMNRIIPNEAWCLFRKDRGGSRNGKIVLVQHRDIQDPENGGSFTVKYYRSKKVVDQDSYQHLSIVLSPFSSDGTYAEIQLKEDQLNELKVIGEFVQVIR